MTELTHGSLFSGIGGFDIGAEWSGIKTLWACDIDPFCRRLSYNRFKHENQYDNIKRMVQPIYVDIISGGFPCQDISIANPLAKGIKGKRSGYWSEMFRVCGYIRPRYIVIENSSALTIRGLEQVLCDLSEIGYDAEWQSLQCRDFGMQHKRERIFIIAYPNSERQEGINTQQIFRKPKSVLGGFNEIVYPGWRERRDIPEPRNFRSANGIPDLLDRIKTCGNAVSPIITFYLFQCIIKHYEKTKIQQQVD